jgi:hypothetical protein
MKKRGKILRDAASGPGLLMLEGQQYHFSLEGVWKSDTLPKPGQVVDVELDADGKVRSITPVPDSQLAQETADAQTDAARTRHPYASFLNKIGPPRLAAAVVLAGAWFFLTTASVQVPFPGTMEFTLWQILRILHDGRLPEMLDGRESPGPGLYGLAAIVALTGPFLHDFWNDKRALLGRLLPLAFLIATGIAFLSIVPAQPGKPADTVSLGAGAHVSLVVCLYFALTSVRELFAPRARDTPATESPQQKAA